MASIKVKFKPSTVANHEGTIYYQIIHERVPRQLFTEYHIFPEEWDSKRSMVVSDNNSERMSFISSIRERIRWDVERLAKIVRKLDNTSIAYSSEDVIEEFNRYSKEYTLFNFMEGVIVKLKHKVRSELRKRILPH